MLFFAGCECECMLCVFWVFTGVLGWLFCLVMGYAVLGAGGFCCCDFWGAFFLVNADKR